ncbi:hypothetical protein LB505_013936 [Fusarium chuoi]|nr:hypothetical protein LB505_013936 [Fusarium chuoi]
MLQKLANTYNRSCSLTLESLQACGTAHIPEHGGSKGLAVRGLGKSLVGHVKGLFSTKKLALSTCLIWLSWTLIDPFSAAVYPTTSPPSPRPGAITPSPTSALYLVL